MPWSLKASGLLRKQYAAVGAASGAVFPGALAALEAAAGRGVDVGGLLAGSANGPRTPPRSPTPTAATAGRTDGLDGVRLAPFQLLAVQGRSLAALPHDEQLALIDRLVEHDADRAAPDHPPAARRHRGRGVRARRASTGGWR